jgi:hypothetical protein
MSDQEDYVIIWEAPKLESPEFRLYYDEKGKVVCYSGDKSLEGNYIVIDAMTFAEARPDVRVIDGKISRVKAEAVVHKLMPNETEGISCSVDDISIIVEESEPHTKWKLKTYEL